MICPHCKKESDTFVNVRPQSNHMNSYVNPVDGKVDGVYNSNDETLTVGDKKLVRKDKFVAKPAEVPATVTTTVNKK